MLQPCLPFLQQYGVVVSFICVFFLSTYVAHTHLSLLGDEAVSRGLSRASGERAHKANPFFVARDEDTAYDLFLKLGQALRPLSEFGVKQPIVGYRNLGNETHDSRESPHCSTAIQHAVADCMAYASISDITVLGLLPSSDAAMINHGDGSTTLHFEVLMRPYMEELNVKDMYEADTESLRYATKSGLLTAKLRSQGAQHNCTSLKPAFTMQEPQFTEYKPTRRRRSFSDWVLLWFVASKFIQLFISQEMLPWIGQNTMLSLCLCGAALYVVRILLREMHGMGLLEVLLPRWVLLRIGKLSVESSQPYLDSPRKGSGSFYTNMLRHEKKGERLESPVKRNIGLAKDSRNCSLDNLSSQHSPRRAASNADILNETDKLMPSIMMQERLVEAILEISLYQGAFTQRAKQRILKSWECVYAYKGEVIIKQGDRGKPFYVIESGTLESSTANDIRVHGAAQRPPLSSSGCVRQLRQLGPREYFGEQALIYDTPRPVTILALESCKMWRIKPTAHILGLIKMAPFLEGKLKDGVSCGAGLGTCAPPAPAPAPAPSSSVPDRFYCDHDLGDYRISSQVSSRTSSRNAEQYKDVLLNACLTERSLDMDPTRAVVLQQGIPKSNVRLQQHLIQTLKEVDMCNGLSIEDKLNVVNCFELVYVPKDELIIREDDCPHYFYVIDSGEAAVYYNLRDEATGEMVLTCRRCNLSQGEFFGEQAFAAEQHCKATVTATCECTLWRVHPQLCAEVLSASGSPVVRSRRSSSTDQGKSVPEFPSDGDCGDNGAAVHDKSPGRAIPIMPPLADPTWSPQRLSPPLSPPRTGLPPSPYLPGSLGPRTSSRGLAANLGTPLRRQSKNNSVGSFDKSSSVGSLDSPSQLPPAPPSFSASRVGAKLGLSNSSSLNSYSDHSNCSRDSSISGFNSESQTMQGTSMHTSALSPKSPLAGTGGPYSFDYSGKLAPNATSKCPSGGNAFLLEAKWRLTLESARLEMQDGSEMGDAVPGNTNTRSRSVPRPAAPQRESQGSTKGHLSDSDTDPSSSSRERSPEKINSARMALMQEDSLVSISRHPHSPTLRKQQTHGTRLMMRSKSYSKGASTWDSDNDNSEGDTPFDGIK